jgi:FkbM family methyltransferase
MRNIKIHGKNYIVKLTSEYPSEFFDPIVEILNKHINALDIKEGVIIDIGANQGLLSLTLRDNIPNTGIVCIEPAEENVEHLRYNVTDAVIYPIAISDIDSTGSITQYSGNQTYRLNKDDSKNIPIAKLDSLDIKNVMLIKVDVEGHEIEVLKGAEGTLKKYSPIILLEHHHDLVDKDELYTQIEKINYSIEYLEGATGYIPGRINNYILLPNTRK